MAPSLPPAAHRRSRQVADPISRIAYERGASILSAARAVPAWLTALAEPLQAALLTDALLW